MLLGLIGLVIFIVSFVATTGLTVWFLVKLPADYFAGDGQRKSEQRASVSGWVRFLLRNLLAVALVGLGIILSLPRDSWTRSVDHPPRRHDFRFSRQGTPGAQDCELSKSA